MTLRILVTGSRGWTDREAVYLALTDGLARFATIGLPVLIHGAARGADTLADGIWQDFLADGLDLAEPERYRARDFPSPRARNQHMVNLGATICYAFAQSWASGTGMCARMARRAGIPVIDYGVPTAPRRGTT